MRGCLTETTTCVVAKPLVVIIGQVNIGGSKKESVNIFTTFLDN